MKVFLPRNQIISLNLLPFAIKNNLVPSENVEVCQNAILKVFSLMAGKILLFSDDDESQLFQCP